MLTLGASGMAQQVRRLTPKPDDPSLIPRTHVAAEENQLSHTHTDAH